MGPFSNSFGHLYILLADDYVSRWVEAIPNQKDPLQLESVPKVTDNIDSLSTSLVERIDLVGVDNFLCVLPPYLNDLVNNLKTHYLDFILGKV